MTLPHTHRCRTSISLEEVHVDPHFDLTAGSEDVFESVVSVQGQQIHRPICLQV